MPGQEAEYAREYAALSKLLTGYNGLIAAAANQDLQQLVVNELQRLEVVVIRLYSGPMYKRYNDTARGQVKDVFPTTIALISSEQRANQAEQGDHRLQGLPGDLRRPAARCVLQAQRLRGQRRHRARVHVHHH
jgi:hypothetical protein